MTKKPINNLRRLYATLLYRVAPLYQFLYKILFINQRAEFSKHIVLFINRPQDVDLLVGLHEKALTRNDVCLCFWVSKGCAKRYPKSIGLLSARDAIVEIVSYSELFKVLKKLIRTDVFLSTVETTFSKDKLPYMITKLANAVQVQTYTLQHGFETAGLTYYDEIHGPEIRFAAKTVLTWGPVAELPAWVDKETRDKAVAVGYPLKVEDGGGFALSTPTDQRPIIGIFDNLHWHRYSKSYISTFLNHLEETARQRSEFRFILRSHPASIRNRSKEMAARLSCMENVELAELLGEVRLQVATQWLLTHALGVITTPSTLALDGAFARVPVALTRYGLDLGYYSPLCCFDNLEDWQRFLNQLTEMTDNQRLKLNGIKFLNRVLVPGDAAHKILNLMTGKQAN